MQALGRQLDRRERVLDLVREAARDLAPGDRALGRDHVGDVVEHDDEAAARPHRQARAAREQGEVVAVFGAGTARDLDLLLPVPAPAPAARGRLRALRREGPGDGAGKHFQPLDRVERTAGQRRDVDLQDAVHGIVRVDDDAVGIHHDHAGRHVGQHGLQVGLGAFQRGAVAFDGGARLEQLARHRVERLRERAQFVVGLDDRARRQVALRDGTRALGQHEQRLREVAGDEERRADRGKDGQ